MTDSRSVAGRSETVTGRDGDTMAGADGAVGLSSQSHAKDVIVACDFAGAEQTFTFLDRFEGEERKPFVKIGMELFYAEGPQIVREIKARGHKIFLDLKVHDIPNTARKAMAVLSALDVDMCNVHAAGTAAMMRAALEGLTRPDGTRPLLIAVTQLTSTDQEAMERDLCIHEPLEAVVSHYALTAKSSGLDGVVCSPLEARGVHETCGDDFVTVTPGVRFAGGAVGDQKRVTTPARARDIGSDYIVVGRPITQADDPVAAYRQCVREFLAQS
ncbi:MAG: orotidine-5'-phosphate decarboxylase [Actinomycetaceae bacterium]|nr:orotidine-5'-phosphate decarboxylase [Arcanobacterium sp.]MDD7686814.1 orotidine-5'-phosphate decarboxylase [Actinomycetaceae bacterium]MDY5273603.1 orotidine-5'-phosphate decarboxylase [Arcanobacterium sp.]